MHVEAAFPRRLDAFRASAISALLSLPVTDAWSLTRITETVGTVEVVLSGTPTRIDSLPFDLAAGLEVRTGPASRAAIEYADSSKVELGPETSLVIENEEARDTMSLLRVGRLKAWVRSNLGRRFAVRTPSSVCSVRGTEFEVQARIDGRTSVSLERGLLEVLDNTGRVFTLHPGERLEADMRGVVDAPRQTRTQAAPTPPSDLQLAARRELGLEMSKDEVLAAAARELKLAEYQQGKAMVDVNGERVRLEEYVIRPQADQFKLVVLNERPSRFDYFYYKGTFNKSLPTDLSVALAQLPGRMDTAPDYFLTRFETGRSNTVDSMRELAQGGHLVDVNSNADLTDNVVSVFDPATDRFVDATGHSVFQTLFDKYGFYVNNGLKYGWTGNNLQSYANRAWSSNADPITGAALPALLPVRSVVSSFPDAGQIHQRIYESYGDGTSITWDNYIISDEGKVASTSDFAGVTTGTQFKQRLLGWNYEQVVTATEFQGRKIDLVVEPKIMIQAGLVP